MDDGSLTIDRGQIVNCTQKSYEKLYSSDRPDTKPPNPEMQHELADFPKVELWEVDLAAQQSNKRKGSWT